MPGGSGKDLAADLSRMSPRTKVLYMSGYASQAIRLRAVSGPGLNLIEKPFASDDLLQRVHAVLNNR
jgi:FixJ family two-component response regulator